LTAKLTATGFKASSILRAVSSFISSRTCTYVFIVRLIEECPNSSMMKRG